MQAEAALTEVENALDDAVLKAPYAGTIGSILLGDGEHALPQMTVMKLGDLTRLQAQTEDLSEVDVSRISEGQEASVIVDALDGALLTGTVSQIASLATDRRGDKVYTVSIDLEDVENSDLRWGMSAFVEIDVR